MAFKDSLSRIMQARKIKAVDLSKMTGIGEGLISEYLSGKKEPTGKSSILLAKALNVTLDALWEIFQEESDEGTEFVFREEEKVNLWEEVGNTCLKKALAILGETEQIDLAGIEKVGNLVSIAINIDTLNLNWAIYGKRQKFRDGPVINSVFPQT